MFGVIETKKVKTWNGRIIIANICSFRGKKITYFADGYYYLTKSDIVGKTRARI